MNPMAIAGGVMGSIGGLSKMIMGAVQKKQGEKEKRALVRPVYERPDEAKEIGRLTALRYANPELAGGRQMEENIGLSTANALQAASDFGSSADIYKAQINENNAMNNLGVQSAQQRLASEQGRIDALSTLSDYSDKEFDYNFNIPFQEKRQSALSKINAGMQNINSGIDSIGSMGASLASSSKAPSTEPTNPKTSITGRVNNRATGVLNTIKPSMGLQGIKGFMGGALGKMAFGLTPFEH